MTLVHHCGFGSVLASASVLLLTAIAPAGGQESIAPKSAVPREPIAAILDAFRSHSIVALGDNEGSEQGAAFRLSLIRDPRFSAAVNDIVVEFGSARYQGLIDRFMRGVDIPRDSLRQVWQNTTQVEYTWDLPIYEEFFRSVRAINESLPAQRRLRVLLGDPPIDWNRVHTLDDLRQWLDRDTHAADVVRREVLAKGRHALVIYGDQHLMRRANVRGSPDEFARGLVAQLEKDGTSVFNIHTETREDLSSIQGDVASWPVPSLALLSGTTLGKMTPNPRRPVPLQDQFDAVLYLGPPAVMRTSKLSRSLCSDSAYMDMRLKRLALIPPPNGAFPQADRLKAYCADSEGKRIADNEPQVTELIRATLVDAARGRVDSAHIAAEAQAVLIPMLHNSGPRFLAPLGTLEALTLLADDRQASNWVRRYRAAFASGKTLILSVGLTPAGTLRSLNIVPE